MPATSTKIWRITAALFLLITAISSLPGSAGVADAAAPTTGLDEHYLTVRPDLGSTWVVNLAGMSVGESMLLRSLQGQVNRSRARLYLVDPANPGTRQILDRYVSQGR